MLTFDNCPGALLNDEERLKKLLGDSKAEQDRRIRERLERRKQRLAEGLIVKTVYVSDIYNF